MDENEYKRGNNQNIETTRRIVEHKLMQIRIIRRIPDTSVIPTVTLQFSDVNRIPIDEN